MINKKTVYYVLMFLSLVIAVIALPFLPDTIPAHYNFSGEIDRWGSKYETLIFPFCTIGMGYFMLWMAKISSKDENGGKNNEKIILYTGMGISVFFTAEYCFSLYKDFTAAAGMGYSNAVDINRVVCVLLGIVLVITGNFMPKLRNNGIIGLRTPWSMKNDAVWRKCQVFGGISLIIGGVITVACSIFMEGYAAMCAALGIIIICAIAGTVYSYFAAKKY